MQNTMLIQLQPHADQAQPVRDIPPSRYLNRRFKVYVMEELLQQLVNRQCRWGWERLSRLEGGREKHRYTMTPEGVGHYKFKYAHYGGEKRYKTELYSDFNHEEWRVEAEAMGYELVPKGYLEKISTRTKTEYAGPNIIHYRSSVPGLGLNNSPDGQQCHMTNYQVSEKDDLDATIDNGLDFVHVTSPKKKEHLVSKETQMKAVKKVKRRSPKIRPILVWTQKIVNRKYSEGWARIMAFGANKKAQKLVKQQAIELDRLKREQAAQKSQVFMAKLRTVFEYKMRAVLRQMSRVPIKIEQILKSETSGRRMKSDRKKPNVSKQFTLFYQEDGQEDGSSSRRESRGYKTQVDLSKSPWRI